MTSTSARAQQITSFYESQADRIRRAVAGAVFASAETVEDACQTAWTILLRRHDIILDDRGANWLITVATRQAWQLASTTREVPVGTFQGEPRGRQRRSRARRPPGHANRRPGVVPDPAH